MGLWSFLTGGGKKNPTTTSSGSSQPNSPQSQSVKESTQGIEQLIADKDKYKNNMVVGDNRNEYQMRMRALQTGQTFDPSQFQFTDNKGKSVDAGSNNKTIGNAGGSQAYKKRFPFESGIGKLAGAATNLIPGVGMFKSILGVLGKLGKGAKTGFNTLADKTGITDTKVYQDLAAAPSGFAGDFKNLITGGRGEDDEISLDVEAIKEKKKNKKIANLDTDTNNAVMAMANTKSNITPYNFNANANDFNALRGNRSLDFSQLAGAPNTVANTVGIGGVNLDSTAYNNYLANKAGFADTGLDNTNMVNEMISNPTLLNRASPTGLNYNALGEVSNPQDLDASLGYEFLNNRIV